MRGEVRARRRGWGRVEGGVGVGRGRRRGRRSGRGRVRRAPVVVEELLVAGVVVEVVVGVVEQLQHVTARGREQRHVRVVVVRVTR